MNVRRLTDHLIEVDTRAISPHRTSMWREPRYQVRRSELGSFAIEVGYPRHFRFSLITDVRWKVGWSEKCHERKSEQGSGLVWIEAWVILSRTNRSSKLRVQTSGED